MGDPPVGEAAQKERQRDRHSEAGRTGCTDAKKNLSNPPSRRSPPQVHSWKLVADALLAAHGVEGDCGGGASLAAAARARRSFYDRGLHHLERHRGSGGGCAQPAGGGESPRAEGVGGASGRGGEAAAEAAEVEVMDRGQRRPARMAGLVLGKDGYLHHAEVRRLGLVGRW
jgi:hypothetical protein